MHRILSNRSLVFRCLAFLLAGLFLFTACDQLPIFVPIVEPVNPTETPAAGNDPEQPSERATQTPASAAPAPSPTASPAPALEVDPAELQGRTVRFWHSWSGPLQEALTSLAQTFTAENEWGIQVQPVYQEELDGTIATPQAPDNTPDLAAGDSYQVLVWDTSRSLADLNPYVQDPVWGFSAEDIDDFYPVFWEQGLQDEKRFGLPGLPNSALLYYNRSWARELGYDQAPASIEEFEEQACTAAQSLMRDEDPDNDSMGGFILSTDYSPLLGWITAFGGSVTRTASSGYRFETPEVEGSFSFLRELYDAGCAWLIEEGHSSEARFAARQGLFSTGSTAGIRYQQASFEKEQNDDEWTVIPFPSPQAGSPAVSTFGPSFVMFSSSTEQELASWLFLKWLMNPANHAQLVEASGSLPVRASEIPLIQSEMPAAWQEAAALIPNAQPEPALASWETVRWAVYDAGTQLFRYYFTLGQVPSLTELLEETAADIHESYNE